METPEGIFGRYGTKQEFHPGKANGKADDTPAGNRTQDLDTISASRLAAMELPPVKYIVDGFIAEGLTVLAGRPKVGKSWMALGLAIAVASPFGYAFGSIPVEQGDVLYLALEDNKRRLKRRLNQMVPTGSVQATHPWHPPLRPWGTRISRIMDLRPLRLAGSKSLTFKCV
jgi:hypothetical protein